MSQPADKPLLVVESCYFDGPPPRGANWREYICSYASGGQVTLKGLRISAITPTGLPAYVEGQPDPARLAITEP